MRLTYEALSVTKLRAFEKNNFYEMYLEFRYCFQSHCLKMPFPIHVTVTLEKEGTFSCPPEEFRGKMSAALKDYFSEKLEEEPWSDIEATLCFEVQRIPLFKEKRMMLKLKNICDERANGVQGVLDQETRSLPQLG